MKQILLGALVMCTAFTLSKPWMFYTQIVVGSLLMAGGVVDYVLTIARDYKQCKRELECEAKILEATRRAATKEEQ